MPATILAFLKQIKRLLHTVIHCTIHAPIYGLYCARRGVRWQYDWKLNGFPLIRIRGHGKILIGHRFHATSRIENNSIGVSQPVILTSHGDRGEIIIGDDVGMSGCSITAFDRISIGDRTLIGSGVLITDNDGHPIHPEHRRYATTFASAPVMIGADVFLGARCMVLKGVTIGNGAVVGAGAVVSKDVPAYAVVVGNPARIVGDSRQSGKSRDAKT